MALLCVFIISNIKIRLFAKLGETGIINIGKMVPVLGGVIGGGFDFVETKVIAKRAYKMFIEGDFFSFKKEGSESQDDENYEADFEEKVD